VRYSKIGDESHNQQKDIEDNKNNKLAFNIFLENLPSTFLSKIPPINVTPKKVRVYITQLFKNVTPVSVRIEIIMKNEIKNTIKLISKLDINATMLDNTRSNIFS